VKNTSINQKHPNRRAHNWLVYDLLDRFIALNTKKYKGILYDLGAGESPYKDFILRYADEYVAVDWAGSYHNTNADIVADLNKPLPIDNNVADTILCISVIEHLSEPQIMLDESYRILKSGGELILQVPWQWWIHEAPFDFFRYTPYGLDLLLKKAGFVEINITPQSGFFTTMILKLNYFSQRLIRGPYLMRWFLRKVFSVFWYSGQKLAPFLDKLDSNWELEASGYFINAQKK
jgi:SAM-dependent methyltransferase